MKPHTLESLIPQLVIIARRAGQAILDVAAQARADVQDKADGSPVTAADLASNRVILAGLAELEPALPIVSEETWETAPTPDATTYWLVDPLDGTKEFIKGLGEYTVNIALIDQCRPVLGVVVLPTLDRAYSGGRGLGAFRIDSRGEPQPIAPSPAERANRAVVSRSHLNDRTRAFLETLGVGESLPHGSSLKLCAVAEGSAEIYPRFGPTCLWDTAAGAAVAVSAGCKVLDLAGEPLRYDLRTGIKLPGFVVAGPNVALPSGPWA